MPRGVRNPKPEDAIVNVEGATEAIEAVDGVVDSGTEAEPVAEPEGSSEAPVDVDGSTDPANSDVDEVISSDEVIPSDEAKTDGSVEAESGDTETSNEAESSDNPGSVELAQTVDTGEPEASDSITTNVDSTDSEPVADKTWEEPKIEEIHLSDDPVADDEPLPEYFTGQELEFRMSTVRVYTSSVATKYTRIPGPLFIQDPFIQHNRIRVASVFEGVSIGWIDINDIVGIKEIIDVEEDASDE